MKSRFVPACLSLLCTAAFAVEPAAPQAGACTAPVFPAESTTVKEANAVQTDFIQWRICVAANPTEENLRTDADVLEKAKAWQKATRMYFNREEAISKTSYPAMLQAREDRERREQWERQQLAGSGRSAFLQDRVTNDVPER